MSRTIALSLVLLLATSSALSAQEPGVAKQQTFGDWTIYEFRDYEGETRPPPTGVADIARTPSLNTDLPKVMLEVSCGRYDVGYSLSENGFYHTLENPDGDKVEKIELMYTKTNREDSFDTSLSYGGYSGRSFDMRTEALIKAGTVMVCSTKDEKDIGCLKFSLKGFTAALKAICAKR
jgi:hypothetical protein